MSDILEMHAEILVDLHLQLEKENFQVTEASVEIFKKLGIEIQRLPLENSLAHGSPLVRGIAAKLLGRLKDTKCIHSLQNCRQDIDPWVRSMVYEALGNFSGMEIADLIAPGLEDSDWKVRGTAIQTISPYRHEGSKSMLVKLLKEEDSEEVKAACARALSFFDDDDLREPLNSALNSALPRTRAMALKALGTKSPYEPAIENIQKCLQDPHAWVKASAAWCLGSWDHFESVELIRSLLDDIDEKVQESAIQSLGIILNHRLQKDEHSGEIDALCQNLTNTWIHKLEDQELNIKLVAILLESTSFLRYPIGPGQREVVEYWANHTEADIRLVAVRVLCNCCAWDAREHLLDIFEQTNEERPVLAATLELLSKQARFQDDATLSQKLKSITQTWLEDENAWLVGAALLASQNMELIENGPAILTHLNHHHPDVRARACQIVAQLKPEGTVKALIYTLREDFEPIVRYMAAQGLGAFIEDEEVQDVLMYALNDEDTSVQISCTQVLCRGGFGRTMKTLQNVLTGNETPLKMATAKSIAQFVHPDWVTWLKSNIEDEPHKLVRAALKESLGILEKKLSEAEL